MAHGTNDKETVTMDPTVATDTLSAPHAQSSEQPKDARTKPARRKKPQRASVPAHRPYREEYAPY